MKKKKRLNWLSFFCIIVALLFTTIGYSSLNSNLNISGEALVKADNVISIVDLNVTSVENGAYEQYNNSHHLSFFDYHIVLPNSDSSITYKLDIKNKGSRDYGIAQITGLSDELTYELIGYNIGDKLCTNSTCNNGAIDEVYLKIKYKENTYDSQNTHFSGRVHLAFENFFSVIYNNVPNSVLLKTSVLKSTTFTETIPIPEGYKLKMRMNGVLLIENQSYTYDENTSLLTIPNVTANIVISMEPLGIEYDTTIAGNESSFEYLNTGYEIDNQTFFLEADLSQVDLSDIFENIISIGNDINNWGVSYNYPSGVNLHIYYPETANSSIIEVDVSYLNDQSKAVNAKFQKTINVTSANILRVAFNNNGLYINGEKIFDQTGKGTNVTTNVGNASSYLQTYFNCWNTNGLNVSFGSKEGNNRSNAIYNDIKIFNQLLTAEEMIEKTRIILEEVPIEDEIVYETVTDVSLDNATPTLINYPFEPNNSKFIFTNPNFTDFNNHSLYLEIDVSNLKQGAVTENLISIGNDFSDWRGSNVYDIHVYYPYTANTNVITFSILNGSDYYAQFRAPVSLINNKLIKLMFCKTGIYVNGEKWFSADGQIKQGLTVWENTMSISTIVAQFFEKFTFPNDNNLRFMYGSTQGKNRSSATYNVLRLYNGVLSEEEIISLTS